MKKKRFLSMVLCLVLVASLFTGFVSTASADDVITHTVGKNENLLKICKAYGLDYYQCKNAIIILNGFTSTVQLNQLSVGQVIKLPATNAIAATVTASSTTTTTTSTSTTVNGTTTTTTSTSTVNGAQANYSVSYYMIPHVVQFGETLGSICTAMGTSYAQYANVILTANGLASANYVSAGKTVYIPSSKAPSSGSCYAVVAHTVQSGETLTSICSTYGTSYTANTKLVNGINYGKDLSKIYVGQTLYVPVVATVGSGATTTASSSSTAAAAVQTGYDITFSSTTNGSPYALVDGNVVSKADPGKTVQVVGNGAQGYAVKSIVVTRADTNAKVDVNLTNNTFVMPGCAVTIAVTYKIAYRILSAATSNGSFACSVGGSTSSYANYGDTVVVNTYANGGYSVAVDGNQYQVYYQLGEHPDSSATKYYASRNSDGTFSFLMPNESVKVSVVFSPASYYWINTDLPNGSIKYEVSGTSVSKAAKGAAVTVTASPASGWTISAATLADSLGNDIVNACGFTQTAQGVYTFTMPANDVIIKFTLHKTTTYSISTTSDTRGTVSYIVYDQYTGNTSQTNVAKEGDTVKVVPNPESGYSYDGINVRYAGGKIDVPIYLDAENYICFTMPAANVTVTTGWKSGAARYNITKNGTSNGSYEVYVTDDSGASYYQGTHAIAGSVIKIKVSPANGYILNKIAVNGLESWPMTNSGTNEYQFIMPETHITIDVTFVESNNFTLMKKETSYVEGTAIGTPTTSVNGVAIEDGSLVKGGSVIVITPPSKEGYSINDVSVTLKNGTVYSSAYNTSKVTPQSDGTYTYTVCDGDEEITIRASFKSTGKHTVQWGQPDNGTYTISVDGGTGVESNVTASNGQSILLTFTPDAGYKVGAVYINNVPVTEEISGDTYQFTMGTTDMLTAVDFTPIA